MKTQSCGVLISRITVRKGKHQNKIQEINDHLRDFVKGKIPTLLTIAKV